MAPRKRRHFLRSSLGRSADGDLDHPVARLADTVRRRHRRLPLTAGAPGDAVARDARLHQLLDHRRGTPLGETLVVAVSPGAVGLADEADAGVAAPRRLRRSVDDLLAFRRQAPLVELEIDAVFAGRTRRRR